MAGENQHPKESQRHIVRAFWKHLARLRLVHRLALDFFVWLDECFVDSRTANPRQGWSVRGKRAISRHVFSRGRRLSVMMALKHDGILDFDVVPGAYNSYDLWTWFVERLFGRLNAFPGPNSIVIWDGCNTHRFKPLLKHLRKMGVVVLILPGYSPWLNPVELMFNTLKAVLRKMRPASDDLMMMAIVQIIRKYAVVDYRPALRRAGYGHMIDDLGRVAS